jgi:ElaB/YqjD/DUF883 family membrane-anchored ribosome-binding protein
MNTTSSYGSTHSPASSSNHPQVASSGATTESAANLKDNVSDAIGRGGAGIAQAAQGASENLASDVGKLRADIASMQQTLSKFLSQAGGEAAKSARDVGQAVASQVSSATGGLVDASAEMASQAKDQMKTFASELETMARKNPLGTLAATLVAGVVIGMMTRGRS